MGSTSFGTAATTQTMVCFEDRYWEGSWEIQRQSVIDRRGRNVIWTYEMKLEGTFHQECYCVPGDEAENPQPPKWKDKDVYNDVTDVEFEEGSNETDPFEVGTLTTAKGEIRFRPAGYPKRKGDCIVLPENPYVGAPRRKNCNCFKDQRWNFRWVFQIDENPEDRSLHRSTSERAKRRIQIKVYEASREGAADLSSEAADANDDPFNHPNNGGSFSDPNSNFLGCSCTEFVDVFGV
tara:strand:+ start:603 stop:1310 length:708 start_codon:yes stop_codon:yes gene_type:complete